MLSSCELRVFEWRVDGSGLLAARQDGDDPFDALAPGVDDFGLDSFGGFSVDEGGFGGWTEDDAGGPVEDAADGPGLIWIG